MVPYAKSEINTNVDWFSYDNVYSSFMWQDKCGTNLFYPPDGFLYINFNWSNPILQIQMKMPICL